MHLLLANIRYRTEAFPNLATSELLFIAVTQNSWACLFNTTSVPLYARLHFDLGYPLFTGAGCVASSSVFGGGGRVGGCAVTTIHLMLLAVFIRFVQKAVQ